ncbi:flagellar biosynthetic protein FliO [Buchnera aphidicola]|uniref:flagellar biosynthetic protein FliO n=1 Tax=Buchnera aphidicola TaxID=9 RepID=UPI00346489B7
MHDIILNIINNYFYYQNTFFIKILILFFLFFLFFKRVFSLKKSYQKKNMNILAQIELGQKKKIILLNIETEKLVLGITPHHIQLLYVLPKTVKKNTKKKIIIKI